MAVIKANKVEFEIIKQNVNGAAAKYLIKLSFEPMQFESKEIVSLILTNQTPYITLAEEDERCMNILQDAGPDGHTTHHLNHQKKCLVMNQLKKNCLMLL